MFPGMGALRSEYRFLAPALREAGYRAVTADLRGHGGSSVPWERYDVPSVGEDVLAMVQHLDETSAHVVATSFSAGSAVWAAVERPQRVRSLVLIGAFVRDAKLGFVVKAGAWLMMNNPWRARTWVMYYRRLYPARKPADFGVYLAELRANMGQSARFDAAKALANSSRRPAEERLERVAVPTLVVMGTKDPDFLDPVAEARFIAQRTGGRMVLVEGAGHYPQTEVPDETAPMIVDFLRVASQGSS
jgi:pimeloyl-ACP methyl ester carboxylesterase